MVLKPVIHVVRNHRGSLLWKLQLQEALFRCTHENWCVLSRGPRAPCVVLGISGKPETMLRGDLVAQRRVPVIRRFSGGGTVVSDANTLFVSMILNKCNPPRLTRFFGAFYEAFFAGTSVPGFSLLENDYVLRFGERMLKCAGNAQCFSQDRMVHHTSFLWGFSRENMDLLQNPAKQPKYREKREHSDFLAPLAPYFASQAAFFHSLQAYLPLFFEVQETPLEGLERFLQQDHRRVTELLSGNPTEDMDNEEGKEKEA